MIKMKINNVTHQRTCILLVLLLASGCETAFDPFDESDRSISVMGYLDVNADTQFVRVELLRDSLLLGSRPDLDVEVSLKNQLTGETSEWQDSLFQFGEDVFVHNYWSTAQLMPGNPYQFVVEPATGPALVSNLTMPGPFTLAALPEITCFTLARDCVDLPFFQLDFEDLDRVAAMLAIYRYPDFDRPKGCKELRIHYWEDVEQASFGSSIVINWRDDLTKLVSAWPDIPVDPTFATMDIFVGAGGPEWPDFVGIDRETLFLPEIFTNIENGIGFLGGVLTSSIRLYDNEDFCDFRTPEIGAG